MATKTLTITEDAYERLAAHKENNDSFSDVIVKHFPKHSLLELVGLFTHKEVAQIRKNVQDLRGKPNTRMEAIAKRFK